jgi:16S rRNA processing protein RimM
VVVDVVHGPGGDLLELRKDAGGNVLVPFVDAICVDVDVVAKRIRLDPPPGLLELV